MSQLQTIHLAATSDEPLNLRVSRADGSYIYDPQNKPYLDLIAGICVNNIGHSHPAVIKAVKEQMDKHTHVMVYGEFQQQVQGDLAAKLTSYLPDTLSSVYLVNSGSEAVEGALKLARKATGKDTIVACHGAYHGSTMGALSVIGEPAYREPFGPLVEDVLWIGFNNTKDLDTIDEDVAAVIIEPVQGEAGVRIPDSGYLEALRARCDEIGALLIFDEIQTGMGRLGSWFALDHFGVAPDVLLLAKAFGGGLPLGAFCASEELMASLSHDPPLGHITTFGGHPLSCAAALATLNVLETEDILGQVEVKGERFEEKLKHTSIKGIRRSGLLMAIELGSEELNLRMVRKGLENGIILDWFLFDNTSFRISPPLTISDQEIDQGCDIILKTLDELA